MFSDSQFINYGLKVRFLRREIICAVAVLVSIGILFVYDVSSIYAWWHYHDAMYFLKRHAVFVVMGVACLFACLRANLETVRRYVKPLLLCGILSLVLVLVLGRESGGARRWLYLFGLGIQPVEFVKVIYIIYIADYLTRKKKYMNDFPRGVLPLLLVTGLLSGLIVMEPDLGNSVFLFLLMFTLLFIAGLPRRYIMAFVVLGLSALVALIVVSPYRMARVLSFLDPWQDAQGKGFQLVQSQIALGSGGLTGLGFGESVQKLFFLPAVHTDFIYAVIGEELGLLGCVVILGVYLFVFVTGLRLLHYFVTDEFKYYVGLSVLLVFTIEALINIAVVTGSMPTKGLPLPFISYGGSATVANFIMLGMFFNATRDG